MAQASVSIRMDADLKRQFDEFCSEIGMTMTTAFCVFAKTRSRQSAAIRSTALRIWRV